MKTTPPVPQAHPPADSPPGAPVSSPGVLILGVRREPLYLTVSAHKFLAELSGLSPASWADAQALPPAIHHVCDELEQNGQRHPAGTDWDKMQVRHLAHTAQRTVLVRGYGVVGHRGGQPGRFLILFSAESPESDRQGRPTCRFTERQQAILNGLLRGLTNKEIAQSLLISVHTVKEYVRQLMMKLETGSRTGIVARVAGLTLSSKPPGGPSRPRAGGSQTGDM